MVTFLSASTKNAVVEVLLLQCLKTIEKING